MSTDRWIFGYGSLIWRPAFVFVERRPGFIEGFERRFWQHSPDHRGVPQAPGRVVTLVPRSAATCVGMAYRVQAAVAHDVLGTLDVREQGGYARHELTVHTEDGSIGAVTFVAGPENPHYAGEAPLAGIAAQVRRAVGPSGPNVEYVMRLAGALRGLGASDPHVFALEALLRGAPADDGPA